MRDVASLLDFRISQMDEAHGRFLSDARVFDDFYNGDHWRHAQVALSDGLQIDNTFVEGGSKVNPNNICDMVVDINTEILIGNLPDFNIPKPQEIDPFVDADPYSEDEDVSQTDLSSDISKALRLILGTWFRGELDDGATNGSLYGRTVFVGHLTQHKKHGAMGKFFSLDPRLARMAFSTSDFRIVEFLAYPEKVSMQEMKEKYKEEIDKHEVFMFAPEEFNSAHGANVGWEDLAFTSWSDQQIAQNPMVEIWHAFEGSKYRVLFKKQIIHEETIISKLDENGVERPPVWFVPNLPVGRRRTLGQSDIKRILPLQVQINRLDSLDYDVLKDFGYPSKVYFGNRESVLQTIAGVGSFSIRLLPEERLEYKQPQIQNFPLKETINRHIQQAQNKTGLTNAVLGDPAGSINTGTSLKIQFHPAIRKIQRKAQIFWKPALESMYSWLLEATAKSNVAFAELIGDYFEVEVDWNIRTPQDQAAEATTDINLIDRGVLSRERVMKKYGVKNTEYEQQKILIEKMLDAKVKATQQAIMVALTKEMRTSLRAGGAVVGIKSGASSEDLASQENAQIVSGQEVPPTNPSLVDDFEAHNRAHFEFMQSPQFKGLPDQIKQLFAAHLENVPNSPLAVRPLEGGRFRPTREPAEVKSPVLTPEQNQTEEIPGGKLPEFTIPKGEPIGPE